MSALPSFDGMEPPKGVEISRHCPLGLYYYTGANTMGCRCIVCARCNEHTGSTTQGHWWALCRLTRSLRPHHFCCPGDCELGADTSGSAVPFM